MVKLKKHLKLKSLMSRLLIFVYLDILALSVFLGLFAYRNVEKLTIDDIGISQQQFVKEVSRMVGQDLDELQNYMEIIMYDKVLNEVLQDNLINSLDMRKYQVDKQIQMQVSPGVRDNGLIGALVIVNKGEGALSYIGSFSRIGFREDLERYIKEQDWYREMMSRQVRTDWHGFGKVEIFNNDYDNKEYLSFSMAIPDVSRYPNFECVGAAYVVLNQEFFVQKLKNLVPEPERKFYICDETGRLVAASVDSGQDDAGKDHAGRNSAGRNSAGRDRGTMENGSGQEGTGRKAASSENASQEDTGKDDDSLKRLLDMNHVNVKSPRGYFTFEDKTGKFLVASQYNERYRLGFVEIIPVTGIVSNLHSTASTIVKIILICAAFFFVLVFFEVKRVLDPLQNLFTTISKIKKGHMQERVYYEREDEIGRLGRLFNEMMDEINRVEKERARHEFESLQAQISPHFLYNTLNTIRMMAINQNANDIRFAITSLVKLFRSTYGKGGPLIPLREELEILNHYVHLQQIRYGNSFSVEFEVNEDVMDLNVIKLMLQPIVENAIFYGVSGLQGGGRIVIEGFREGRQLVLKVRDNGRGMPVELIEEVLKRDISGKDRFSSVGLFNINQRIKLHFGEEFGIQIESGEGTGTCVVLKLPQVYPEDDARERVTESVQDSDRR